MAANDLLEETTGKRLLLLGNEAFARGAVEAGIQFAAGYPGTPSSEILENIGSLAKEAGIYAEWSVNEKVAFEVAYAASLAGLRSLVTFKSVGLNVAADSLMVANAAGVEGGFCILTADDPFGHSSQNEQDTRYFAKMAEIPILEPADPQEAKDSIRIACELSEKSKLPVIVRSVTRVSHVRGDVSLGPVEQLRRAPALQGESVYTGFPCVPHHQLLKKRLEAVSAIADEIPLNKLESRGGEKIGIITSSVGYVYTREMVGLLGIEGKAAILKIGIANPLPVKLLRAFMGRYERILVLEDGFPYLEEELRKLTYDFKVSPEIWGKLTGHLPAVGELTPELVGGFLAKAMGDSDYQVVPLSIKEVVENTPDAPKRSFTLCAGCAHMATWFAMKQAVKGGKTKIRKGAVVCGDIGCYGLGLYPPYNMYNTHICMGASIGVAGGMGKLDLDKPVLAYLGESTFFHSGMPPLVNAVFNKSRLIVIVQDNQSTAMTGHQVNPAVGRTLTGDASPIISVEDVARAMQVPFVRVVDPYDVEKTVETIKEAINSEGPAVIVARRKCAEQAKRLLRRKGLQIKPPLIDPDLCTGCKVCINQLLCPALVWDGQAKKVSIDEVLCAGCGVCAQVCSAKAITECEGIHNV